MNKGKLLVMLSLLAMLGCQGAAAEEYSHRQAAERLVQVMHPDQSLRVDIDRMVELEIKSKPPLAPYQEILRAFFIRHLLEDDAVRAELARLYLEEFSEQELKEMTAFYTTPVGRKALERSAVLLQKAARLGRSKIQQNLPELEALIAEEDRKNKAREEATLH